MSLLKNIWYMAGWAHEISDGGMAARTIADVPVVMFRAADGVPCAMLDRCAHRLAPLSKGQLCAGRVKCGYHGLVYDERGRCVENPHGPIVAGLRVPTYPLVERYGMLWLWLGERDAADTKTIPDFSVIRRTPKTAFYQDYLCVEANHQLLVDNILDLSHIDYLHPTLLGSGSMQKARPQVEVRGDRVFVQWLARNDRAIPLFAAELPDPDMAADAFFEVDWYPGGAMQLSAGAAPAGMPREAGPIALTAHIMTPQSETTTHYFWCMWRNYRQDSAEYNQLSAAGLRNAFGNEDRPMIEAQQARVGDAQTMANEVTLLAIDAAPNAARRIYQRLLAAERGTPAQAAMAS